MSEISVSEMSPLQFLQFVYEELFNSIQGYLPLRKNINGLSRRVLFPYITTLIQSYDRRLTIAELVHIPVPDLAKLGFVGENDTHIFIPHWVYPFMVNGTSFYNTDNYRISHIKGSDEIRYLHEDVEGCYPLSFEHPEAKVYQIIQR